MLAPQSPLTSMRRQILDGQAFKIQQVIVFASLIAPAFAITGES
jgi:hypothetical protein